MIKHGTNPIITCYAGSASSEVYLGEELVWTPIVPVTRSAPLRRMNGTWQDVFNGYVTGCGSAALNFNMVWGSSSSQKTPATRGWRLLVNGEERHIMTQSYTTQGWSYTGVKNHAHGFDELTNYYQLQAYGDGGDYPSLNLTVNSFTIKGYA